MDLSRRAPQLGLAACFAVFGALLWPYLYLPAEAYVAVGRYYGSGTFGVTIIAALAVIALVILGAGLTGRSTESTVAGATIAIGGFMTAMTIEWAIAVRSFPETTWIDYHPWVVLASVLLIPISGVLYARGLDLL